MPKIVHADCEHPMTRAGRAACRAKRTPTAGTPRANNVVVIDPYERFMAKVDSSGGPSACWEWQAALSSNGCPVFTVNHRIVGARRWLLGHLRGAPLVSPERAGSRCNSSGCMNPEHIYIRLPREKQRSLVPRSSRLHDHCTHERSAAAKNECRKQKRREDSVEPIVAILLVRLKGRTHCKYGHELNEESAYVNPSGYVVCGICNRQRANEYQARKRLAREQERGTPAAE